MNLPSGTVTFLFTDIEGSTRLWEEQSEAMGPALARHDALMRTAIETQGGFVFKTIGDAFCAAFATAPQALLAALAAQQNLQHVSAGPGDGLLLKVRMALHTGNAEQRDADYFGPPLNRVARLLATGHGGQILVSMVSYELVRDSLPPSCLLENLGEHRLRDLTRPETVFQLIHPDLPSKFPPLKSLNNPQLPNNLPQELTSFVGREKETEEIAKLLSMTRLLTLTGSGGCGKTRLSLQVAANALDQFENGIWLVEMAGLADPAFVVEAVAGVLKVKELSGQKLQQTLIDHLQSKRILLLLDNCEHLLSACAQITSALLRACPELKVMATSRQALGISGERTYRVPSLSSPDPKQIATPQSLSQYDAVRLFIERAGLKAPDFAVTEQNAPALAQVCYYLDGIPLAIELAAARARSLSVEDISRRLDNVFRLLTGGDRAALPRQQTLRALIDWSYNLLSEAEQIVFRAVSVFQGGWTLEAVEAVCTSEEIEQWEVLDLLTGLIDKSLVIYEEREGNPHYRLLETVRQYAHDRVKESGELVAVRDRHLDYFVRWVVEDHQFNIVELDNLRAALDWSLISGENRTAGVRLAGALGRFWLVNGFVNEGLQRLGNLLQDSEPTPSPERAFALLQAGNLARSSQPRQWEAACSYLEQSLTLYRELGDVLGIGSVLQNLGQVVCYQGNVERGASLIEESLPYLKQAGDRAEFAWALIGLADVKRHQGATELARKELYNEALSIFKQEQNGFGEGYALEMLAIMSFQQREWSEAQSLYEQVAACYSEGGYEQRADGILLILGRLAAFQGRTEAARALLIRGARMFSHGNDPLDLNAIYTAAEWLRVLGEPALARDLYAESLSQARQQDNLVVLAGSSRGLALLALQEGDAAQSWMPFHDSLAIAMQSGSAAAIGHSLWDVAALLTARSRLEPAACLLGAADQLMDAEEVWTLEAALLTSLDRTLGAVRTGLGADAFAAAWEKGRTMTGDQAAAYALQQL